MFFYCICCCVCAMALLLQLMFACDPSITVRFFQVMSSLWNAYLVKSLWLYLYLWTSNVLQFDLACNRDLSFFQITPKQGQSSKLKQKLSWKYNYLCWSIYYFWLWFDLFHVWILWCRCLGLSRTSQDVHHGSCMRLDLYNLRWW